MILLCARPIANAKIKFFKSIMEIGMDIIVMNLTCASLSVCHFSSSHAEGRFPVPYRFFSHFLTVGLHEMERILQKVSF